MKAKNLKPKDQINIIFQHKGILVFLFLFILVFIFRLFTVTLVKTEIGQESLYLNALSFEREKRLLDVYNRNVSFSVGLNGLPGNLLRADKKYFNMNPYVALPIGNFLYANTDVNVERQSVYLDEKGKISIKNIPNDYLSFKRMYIGNCLKKSADLGFGWTHNFNYKAYKVGELVVIVDWMQNIYTFAYDFKEEKFVQISGKRSMLEKRENKIIWISPFRDKFTFEWSEKFISYHLVQIKTKWGAVYNFEYDDDNGKIKNVVDATSNVSLKFAYNEGGFIKNVFLNNELISSYQYDDYGNLSLYRNEKFNINEKYEYNGFFDVHKLTSIVRGNSWLKVGYDSFGRVSFIKKSGMGRTDFNYDDIFGIVRVSDSGGNIYKYVSERKSALKVIDPYNNENFFFYDANGNVVKEIFANGSYILKKYNDYGQLIELEKAPNNIEYYEYNDKTGLLSKKIDALGQVVKYEFNDYGLPVKKIGLMQDEIFKMEYDAFGRIVKISTPDNVAYEINYDANGNVKKIFSSTGWEKYFSYDVFGRPLIAIDANGNKTEYVYVDKKREKKVIFPDGSKKIYRYDEFGNIKEYVWNKRIKKYEYNEAGLLVKEIENGKVCSYEYDNLGNMVKKRDYYGREYAYKYDKLCRKISDEFLTTGAKTVYQYEKDKGAEFKIYSFKYTKKIEPSGEIVNRVYDKSMQLVLESDSTGNKKEYAYDKLGRLTNIKENDLNEIIYTYDKSGNVESVFKSEDIIFLYEYNWRHQITAVAYPGNNTCFYYYDGDGNLVKIVNAKKQTTKLFYDKNGNIIKVVFPSGLVYKYEYDQLNRISLIERGENDIAEINYDIYGNIISIAHSSGNFEKREYDENGNLVTVTYPDNSTLEFSYDTFGRLTKVKSNDYKKEYEYDNASRIKKIKVDNIPFIFTYTKDGKISKISFPDLYIVTYKYDNNGRLKEIIDSNGDKVVYGYKRGNKIFSINYPNRVKEEFGYNERNLISKKIITNYKNERIFDADFEYNYLDLLASINFKKYQRRASNLVYTYDALGNIVEEKSEDKRNTYSYGRDGSLIAETTLFGKYKRKYDKKRKDRIVKIYDSLYSGGRNIPFFGIMPQRAPEYVSVNDNVCQINKKKKFFYLEKLKLKPGKNTLDITAIDRVGYKETLKINTYLDDKASVSFGYYPTGNLKYVCKKGSVKAYVWNYNNCLKRVVDDRMMITDFYYYEDGRLAGLIDDYGDKTRFVYGPNGNLIAEIQGKNTISAKYVNMPNGKPVYKVDIGGKKFFYHTLPDKSVIILTDRFGNVAKSYFYDCFGNITDDTGRVKNRILFKGMIYDEYSGMYIKNGRFYLSEYRIIANSGIFGKRFIENIYFPFADIFGERVLEMHPKKDIAPLNILQKEIKH